MCTVCFVFDVTNDNREKRRCTSVNVRDERFVEPGLQRGVDVSASRVPGASRHATDGEAEAAPAALSERKKNRPRKEQWSARDPMVKTQACRS